MITYGACLLVGLAGIGLVFAGRKGNEAVIILGAAIYFIALFVAAISSMHTVM